MKTLIVGGNSSLARALFPRLAAFSEVITGGRKDCDITLDLANDLSGLVLPAGLDVVINTASHFGGKTADAMKQALVVNVQAPLALGDACVRAGVKHFVQVSSIFAQLETKSPFFNIYALSKRQADELLQLFCASAGLPLAILRPSQFYGAGDATRRHQPFLSSIIDRAERGDDIELFGSNDARRNFIHIEDVAEATAQAVGQAVTGVYACQHPCDVSYSVIAHAAIRAFGRASAVRFLPDRPDIPDNTLPIEAALFTRLGFQPRISIDRGMEMEARSRRNQA